MIENKTKSVATLAQLERYEKSGATPIALAYVEACFPHETKQTYALLTYRDVHSILSETAPAAGAWGYLLAEYQRFLERELSILARIEGRARASSADEWKHILAQSEDDRLYRQNDRRLFQYFFLAGFRQYLRDQAFLSCSEDDWEINKDQISGVWLAGPSAPRRYSPALRRIANGHAANFWLHVELHNGLFGIEADAPAGEIQLRTSVNEGKLDLIRREVRDAFPPEEDEVYTQRRLGTTGKLIVRTLRERELSYPALLSRLARFAQRFFILDQTLTGGRLG